MLENTKIVINKKIYYKKTYNYFYIKLKNKFMKQSFLDFMNQMSGFDAYKKEINVKVPRYVLYWSSLSFKMIKKKYNLIKRVN